MLLKVKQHQGITNRFEINKLMYELLHLWNDEVKHMQVSHGATVYYAQEIVRRMYSLT
jgi:hypothetical protein